MSASEHTTSSPGFDLVVMIGSLGGLEAISTVLAGLPANFAVPVVVLQHGRRNGRAEVLDQLFQRATALPVRLARTDQRLDRPGITVVPRGYTATLTANYQLDVAPADELGGGDTLLSSAARAGGPGVIGVVLTGMLHDGALGVRAVKRHGGRVLVQDPSTARAGGMPSAAIATGCIDFVLPAHRIPAALTALTMAPGGAQLLTVPTPAWATPHQ